MLGATENHTSLRRGAGATAEAWRSRIREQADGAQYEPE